MKLLLRGSVYFVIACFAPLAMGSPDWTSTGPDTNFDNSLNWADTTGVGTVPGVGDSAHIFPGFTVTSEVTLEELFPIPNGPVTININAAGSETVESLLVSSNFDDFNVPDGTLNLTVGGTLTVGADLAANAGVVITGTSTVNYTGNMQISSGTLLVGTAVSFVDEGQVTGAGTLNLSAGTVAFAPGTTMQVGVGADGTVTQGAGSIVTGVTLTVGSDGGTGTYSLLGSASLTASTIDVGVGTATAGTPQTEGILNSASTLNAGVVDIGVDAAGAGTTIANTTGIVDQTAGTATITTLNVGFAPGTGVTGAYNISGTGVLTATSITLGNFVGATTATNANGSFTQSAGTTVGTTTLTVGLGGTGAYTLQGGALTVGTNLTLGNSTGSIGTFTQSAGTLTDSGTLIVGASGTGAYTLQGGALTVATSLTLGSAGGTGTFTQSGGILTDNGALTITAGAFTQSGGTLAVTGAFTIGGTGTATFNYNGGTLTPSATGIAIAANGIFNQNASLTPTQPISIAASGAYNLNAGVFTTGSATFSGAGNFNFAGGTVAVTGGPWTDIFNGKISGTSTINTAGGDATLSGNLTGAGTLAITGGQTVALTGTNNVADSWGAALTGNGTKLTAMNGVTNLSATGTYTIGTGTTLNLASTGLPTDTFSGTIAGAGTFNTDTTGTATKLVLAGVTNLSAASTTTIGHNGSLEVDRGTISNVNGSLGNPLDTFDVGGNGPAGTVTLLGTNNLLPTVTVNPGSTLFAGNITGSVTNSGTLGTLGTLFAPASLSISGALTSTHTLLVNSNGNAVDSFGTAAARLTSATLSGTIKITGVGSITNVPIVYTTGGVTIGGNGKLNNPSGLATNAPTTLFSSSLSENGAHTELLLSTVQSLLLPYATTPNQAAVAKALDPILQSPTPAVLSLVLFFDNLPANSIGPDLEQLSPEVLQYSRDIAFENSTFLAQRIDGICADLRGGSTGLDTSGIGVIAPGFDSSLGRSLGSLLAYSPFHSSAPNGVNYYPNGDDSSVYPSSAPLSPRTSSSPTSDSSGETISDSPIQLKTSSEAPALRMPRMNGFIAGDVVLANLNQSQSVTNAPSSKASYTAGDALAGISFHITPHLSTGVLFDYNQTNAKTDSSGSKTTANTYSPGVFATYSTHGFYVNGLFAFGLNNYSNTRDIPFLGATAKSSPSGEQYVTNLDLGYDFHPDPKWTLGPTLGVTYTHLDIDSFSESGAGPADLMVNSQNLDSLRSRLGGNLSYQTHTGSVLFQPNVTAMWQHEYLDNNNGITSQFNIPGTNPFTIQSASTAKDSALIGCGVTATLDNSMALYLNYLADVGADDYFAQTIIGGFKASF